MIKIKPGRKLNLAIAKAVGMTWCVSRTIIEAWWYKDKKRFHCRLPLFSTDLHDAFMAAEEIELFHASENTHGQGPWVSLTRGPIGWLIMKGETCIGKGDTPALAICAAILKAAEEKEASMTD